MYLSKEDTLSTIPPTLSTSYHHNCSHEYSSNKTTWSLMSTMDILVVLVGIVI